MNTKRCVKNKIYDLHFSAESNLHVPVIDEFFIAFLRPCKYYPKSAFERVSEL